MLRKTRFHNWRPIAFAFLIIYVAAGLGWAGLGSYLLVKDTYSSPDFPMTIRIMLPLLGLVALGALMAGAYKHYLKLQRVIVKERQNGVGHSRLMPLRVALTAFWLQK